GNNARHPDWGSASTQYLRVGPARYADGVAAMVGGPPGRYVSDRVFNDVGQNLFSENGVTQWAWAWGQFMDHDFGLRDETLADNGALLMLPGDGYLPRADARADPSRAPPMDLMGALVATPDKAVVAGDVRANENIALTALHTLFAREHDRIVALLPTWLTNEERFQI